MQLDEITCRWLTGDEGRRWLARAAELVGTPVQRTAALRRELPADRVGAVLEQLELRERARAKFLLADQLFFMRIGLEQATDSAVANYKAERFRGCHAVADLCCGVGGDLLALARIGSVTGIDRDPAVGVLAAANLEASGLPGSVVAAAIDAERLDTDAWHIDPDRRPGGRRSVKVENHEPGFDEMERLLVHAPNGAIKLAPGAEVPTAWQERAELEWISRGGECKQLVAWFGQLARSPGSVRATVVARPLDAAPGEQVLAALTGKPGLEPALAAGFGRYLFEPDAAVLAADLTGALAEQVQLDGVTPGIAYLTGDEPIPSAALSCFEIVEVMPFRLSSLKPWLSARNIGRLEIKKRSVDESPEKLRKDLRLKGSDAATLFLMPVERSVTAIIARRIAST